jgi:hypothetical protein
MLVTREVTIAADEGIRADTTLVSKIRSAVPGGVISAGNASQFRWRFSCYRHEHKVAEAKGLQPLGIFRGFAVVVANRMKWVSAQCLRFLTVEKSRTESRRHRLVGIE